jgi:heat-inducible transcriptional repressor
MADLEEMGLLEQPHTSAGRIPTDLGYRYYIDHLVAMDMTEPEADIVDSLKFTSPNVPVLMQEFSRRLGNITGAVGFVATSKPDTEAVQLVEFTRLNKNTALAVLVTRSGFTHNVLLPMEQSVTDGEFIRMSNYLNDKLATMSIMDIGEHIRYEMDRSAEEVRDILSRLAKAEQELLAKEIYLEGASNILNFPEFHDTKKLRMLLRTFEEKKTLFDVIEKCTQNKGVQIFIGSEVGIGYVEELGVITSAYEGKGNIVGMVGVIGPKRMPYPKMISVVNYSALAISRILNQIYGGCSDYE